MFNRINRIQTAIKGLFGKKRAQEEYRSQREKQMLYDHIVAIARLSMIKPQTLFKEARNVKANAEFLMRMAEEMNK